MKFSRTRVKFCGMTRAEDIRFAIELGVDALGFILYSGSKRAVTLAQLKALTQVVPLFVHKVVVMVNPSFAEVKEVINTVPDVYLQFHGHETAEFCEQFEHPYIKALPAVSPASILEGINRYINAAAILLDTPSEGFGGVGKVFDWQQVPDLRSKPIILAGGLSVENVATAINTVRPLAVDVSTGIERSPGIKDQQKMADFYYKTCCTDGRSL